MRLPHLRLSHGPGLLVTCIVVFGSNARAEGERWIRQYRNEDHPAPDRAVDLAVLAQVIDAHLPAGEHEIEWNGRLDSGARAPAGVTFYRLEADGESRVGKLVIEP